MLRRGNAQERRYSPGECCGAVKTAIRGNPARKEVSTMETTNHSAVIGHHFKEGMI